VQRPRSSPLGAVLMAGLVAAPLLALAGCGNGNNEDDAAVPPIGPEQSLDVLRPEAWPLDQPVRQPLAASRHMVSAADPTAVRVGRDVLRGGGNAMDAAVAIQMVLTLVEPSESGIGGGAFLLYRDGASGELTVYDGRETAPAAAGVDRFMWLGMAKPLWAAIPMGLSVGVPGTLAMLHQAHGEHGERPWSELFQPAIRLADQGVPMPEQLQRQVAADRSLWLLSDTRRYFVDAARQDPPRLHNPELAHSLRLIAEQGPEAFYVGPMAENIVIAAGRRRPGGSDMTMDDLLAYTPKKREALCGGYRGRSLCGLPPPSSGGIAILQILGMLEHMDMAALEPASAEAIHLIAEASRLAFADRSYYVGDPDFVDVPTAQLLDPDYLAARARLIDPLRAMDRALPGEPGVRPQIHEAPELIEEETTGTTHFSIVDGDGNVVSMTSSIEAPFGSRIMVDGFLLNNQLTDFTFRAEQGGVTVPNAVAPGKRPRSSMSPIIVRDAQGEVELVIGSRGGSRIIGYVVKALVGVLDWDMDVQEAISLANFVHRGEGLELERGTAAAGQGDALTALGHDVRVIPLTSGLHGIGRNGDGWHGGADPRLGGIALGD